MILIVGNGCKPQTTGAVTACISPEVQINERCCLDFDENGICDDEQTIKEDELEEPAEKPAEEIKENNEQTTEGSIEETGIKPEPKTYVVEIRDFKYNPEELEIKKGDSVVWVNKEDAVPHAIYEINGRFGVTRFMPGESFGRTFTEPGEYIFSDQYQKFMRGKVTVK